MPMGFSLFYAYHLRRILRLSHVRRPLVASPPSLPAKSSVSWPATRYASSKAVLTQNASTIVNRSENNGLEALPVSRIPQVRAFGFRELGFDEDIIARLEKAFPDVQRPTLMQTEYIPAILEGKDVVIHDETGTGKSFGIVLSLLSKVRTETLADSKHKKTSQMALVIVPHRDLGYQMMQWITAILDAPGKPDINLDEVVQLVVRGDSTPLRDKVERISSNPPRVLIGTPQVLTEMYSAKKQSLHVDRLSTLVVDEADYLLDVPPPYLRKAHRATAWRRFNKHPSLTRLLLDKIIPLRKPGAVALGEEVDELEDDGDGQKKPPKAHRPALKRDSLQIVMASATIHSGLREHLERARWLSADTVYVSGEVANKKNAHMAFQVGGEAPEVIHHAFVVDRNGNMSNVEFASKPMEDTRDDVNENEVSLDSSSSRAHEEVDSNDEDAALPENLTPQSPLDPQMLEAVATFFAFDVPNLALLVLPQNASVVSVVSNLQQLGVNALNFDMRSSEITALASRTGTRAQEPVLLVATPAATRGVDLPALTHVFMLGAPDVANVDVFKHIAGRVDRFGRGGKVVTFLTELEKEYRDGIMKTKKNPAGLLKSFYRMLGIKPTWYDLSTFQLP